MSIHVSGSQFIDANGNVVQLRGVAVSALESYIVNLSWSAANPWAGQTGTPTPQWTVIAKSWGANAVRIPLNEACWNGGTYVNSSNTQINADPDGIYKSTVDAAIAAANAAGLYVILDLHWAAPGNLAPTTQNAMADQPNSINFWTSVASRYKSNPAVIFELFNEPFLDVAGLTNLSGTNNAGYYLLNGGGALDKVLWAGGPETTYSWTTAGHQQMLDAVRAAGAPNVVLTSTMNWSTTMDQWLAYKPTDVAPAGYTGTWTSQIGAVWHAYPNANDKTQVSCIGTPSSCSARMQAAVQGILAAGYPVVITEYGDYISSGTVSPFVSLLLPWADANGVSYLGWTWDAWQNPAFVLITDAAGDPTPGYGAYVKQHYLCRAAGTANCP